MSDASRPPESDDAEHLALRLWIVLSRAQQAVERQAAADVARHGLTLAEFGVLEALHHKGPMLLGDVQRSLLVSSGGVTYLVDRLEGKGLVRRDPCPEDRRARYAALTPEGTALIARIFPEHAAAIARAMAGLTPEEQRAARTLLRTLGRGVGGGKGEGGRGARGEVDADARNA